MFLIITAILIILIYGTLSLFRQGAETKNLTDLLADVEKGKHFNLIVSGKTSGRIETLYTCDGKDISPPVSWNGLPEGTESLVLMVYDPDAPKGIFVHWVVYNIPPSYTGLEENFPKREVIDGILQGVNDFGKIGYGGPCPPHGKHRYVFLVLALDQKLDAKPGMTAVEVLSLARDHVLGYGKAVLTYERG